MNSHICIQTRSLSAQGKGTRTQFQSLMVDRMAVAIGISVFLGFIACIAPPGCRALSRTPVSQPNCDRRALALASLVRPLRLAALTPCKAMPRLRGTPRRGAAWHAAKSRRERKEAFERAIAVVARRRRMWGMAIVEEEIPAEGTDSPPVHTLFTVPENWHPRTHFGFDSTPGLAGGTSSQGGPSHEEHYSPCYIEEEAPPEPDRAGSEGNKHGATADTTQAQPPLADEGYLNLIFEVRTLLDDHTFRIMRLEQRLDMFFAVHSRAMPKKQCPTCGRAYAFPARWRHTADHDTPTGTEVI